MREKYHIRGIDGDWVLGLRYDPAEGQVMVYGPVRFGDRVDWLAGLFGKAAENWLDGQGSSTKSKWMIRGVTPELWAGVTERIEEEGLANLKKVRRLGRIGY